MKNERPWGSKKYKVDNPCQRCRGTGLLEAQLKNLGTLDYEWHIIGCPMCDDKGYVTEEDRNRVCTT